MTWVISVWNGVCYAPFIFTSEKETVELVVAALIRAGVPADQYHVEERRKE